MDFKIYTAEDHEALDDSVEGHLNPSRMPSPPKQAEGVFKASSNSPFGKDTSWTDDQRQAGLSFVAGSEIHLRRTTFLNDGMDACVMLPQNLKAIEHDSALNLRGVARCHGKEIQVWLLLNRPVFGLIQESNELGERKLFLNLPQGLTWEM